MEQSAAYVIIVGPKSLSSGDATALKVAFEQLGAEAVAFRTDVDFTFEKFKGELKKATHLLVVLDRQNGYADSILFEADKAAVSTSFLCLYTDDILSQFERRIRQAKVDVVIVRSALEHARISSTLCRHTLVAENIEKSARDIAQAMMVYSPVHRKIAAQ